MKKTVYNEKIGQIVYEENFFTGKKRVSINGEELEYQSKNTFAWYREKATEVVYIEGNNVKGATITVGGTVVELCEPATWYEWVCTVFIFALIIVWGTSPTLCRVIPVVGGAIGGAIAGGMGYLNMLLMKAQSKVLVKLAIWLGMTAATFAICFVVAKVILLAFA